MSYKRKIWVPDEIITDEALNNIEDGIKTIERSIEGTDIKIYRIREAEIGTTYFVAKIPYMNSDGSRNVVRKAYANDISADFSFPAEMAIQNKAILGCNASAYFYSESQGYKMMGLQIKDGIPLDNVYASLFLAL